MDISTFIEKCCLASDEIYQYELHSCSEKISGNNTEKLIAELCTYLKKKFKYNICPWETNNRYYPGYMLLGGDKGILAYICFNYYETEDDENLEICYPLSDTVKMISYAGSRLDRPVFIIDIINKNGEPLLLFETNEQIKDRIYYVPDSYDKGKDLYYADIETMGDIDGLKRIFDGLYRNSVKQY